MRCYTTLWNVCAQKSLRCTAEWSKLSSKRQPFETFADKCSSNGAYSQFFHWRKDIYSCHTEKIPTESPTVGHTHLQQPRRKTSRQMPAHTINVQPLMASVGESQVVDIAVWYLAITESKLVSFISRNVMLLGLQHFLPTIRQISSEFVIFQQDSTREHRALKANLGNQLSLPITSPDVDRFLKFF